VHRTHPRRRSAGRNDFSPSAMTSARWRSSTGSVRKTRNEVPSGMDSILLKDGTITDGTGPAPGMAMCSSPVRPSPIPVRSPLPPTPPKRLFRNYKRSTFGGPSDFW
jgi:hypothetical protein